VAAARSRGPLWCFLLAGIVVGGGLLGTENEMTKREKKFVHDNSQIHVLGESDGGGISHHRWPACRRRWR
jgi:hypothetical protein